MSDEIEALLERVRAAYARRLNGVEVELSFKLEIFSQGGGVEVRHAWSEEGLETALTRFAVDAEGRT